MKKIIHILLVLILGSTSLFSQKREKLISICENFNYQELIKELDILKKSNEAENKYSLTLKRVLVNNYFEKILYFENINKNKINYSYVIKMITKFDEVAYYKIIEFKKIKVKTEWKIRKDIVLKVDSNNLYEQLKIDYQKIYKLSLDDKFLFETEISFGDYCGFIGVEPNFRIRMNSLVNFKDTTNLINWLKSDVIEIQLYGIEGLLTLYDNGIELNNNIINLIDTISQKEGTANICSGCLFGKQSIKEIVEKIRKEHNRT